MKLYFLGEEMKHINIRSIVRRRIKHYCPGRQGSKKASKGAVIREYLYTIFDVT